MSRRELGVLWTAHPTDTVRRFFTSGVEFACSERQYAAGLTIAGLAVGTASADTIDAGIYSSRAACEAAGKAAQHGEVIGYDCSAAGPNKATGDYNYVLYLTTKDPNRPCQTGGTGSASASAEMFCLFQTQQQ